MIHFGFDFLKSVVEKLCGVLWFWVLPSYSVFTYVCLLKPVPHWHRNHISRSVVIVEFGRNVSLLQQIPVTVMWLTPTKVDVSTVWIVSELLLKVWASGWKVVSPVIALLVWAIRFWLYHPVKSKGHVGEHNQVNRAQNDILYIIRDAAAPTHRDSWMPGVVDEALLGPRLFLLFAPPFKEWNSWLDDNIWVLHDHINIWLWRICQT